MECSVRFVKIRLLHPCILLGYVELLVDRMLPKRSLAYTVREKVCDMCPSWMHQD